MLLEIIQKNIKNVSTVNGVPIPKTYLEFRNHLLDRRKCREFMSTSTQYIIFTWIPFPQSSPPKSKCPSTATSAWAITIKMRKERPSSWPLAMIAVAQGIPVVWSLPRICISPPRDMVGNASSARVAPFVAPLRTTINCCFATTVTAASTSIAWNHRLRHRPRPTGAAICASKRSGSKRPWIRRPTRMSNEQLPAT